MGCHWWGVYTPFDVDPKWPKLRAIDEPSSSGTDSRKRTKNVMSFKNSDTQISVACGCARVPDADREFVHRGIRMRATLDYMRTVEEFPTHARHTTMQTTSPRTGNAGIIDTQRAGAYQVAANTIPCPPWLPIPWLPIINPSRIPPESPPPAAASTYVRRVHNPKSTSALGLYS